MYCAGDNSGSGSGWRVGEVSIPDKPSAFPLPPFRRLPEHHGGRAGIRAGIRAEQTEFDNERSRRSSNSLGLGLDGDDEEDDDGSGRDNDATPARTPAVKRSPLLPCQCKHRRLALTGARLPKTPSMRSTTRSSQPWTMTTPDEAENVTALEAADAAEIPPPLRLARPVAIPHESSAGAELSETPAAWTLLGAGGEACLAPCRRRRRR